MKKEIISHVDLENIKNLDNHSLLNACEVFRTKIEDIHKETPCVVTKKYLDFCQDLLLLIGDPIKDNKEKYALLKKQIEDIYIDLKEIQPQKRNIKYSNTFYQLFDLIPFLSTRFEEFLINRFDYLEFTEKRIKDILFEYIKILQITTKYNYNIMESIDDVDQSSYNILFESSVDEPIIMPHIINDLIRDLFSNSRKYSNIGSVIIIKMNKKDNMLFIRVEDNGYGIPENEIEKVVEEGYRASNMHHRKTMGGGFGLTKAYAVCKTYNGQFWIDSELNRGTTIVFSVEIR